MINRLDLLLVNAPSRLGVYGELAPLTAIEPPVWAGLIATYCLERGYTVQILDAEAEGMTTEQAASEIHFRLPRLAVFCIYGHQPSASTQCLPAASVVARLVDESVKGAALLGKLKSNIATLALGTHPSALPERTLREEPFDYVCQGEGPETVAGLIEALRNDFNGISTVPGLWGRFVHKTVLAPNTIAVNITDLDAKLPRQAWELLDMSKYLPHNWHEWTHTGQDDLFAGQAGTGTGGYASVQTSLGCPYACSFCCINTPFGGRGIRYWSPRNVAQQIERLVYDYGITNLKIPDEMFVLNPKHVRGICEELIARKLGGRLNMWAYARVDTVRDGALLKLMCEAGFRWLGIGIESGSKHVRDGVEKGRFGDEDIEVALQRVRDAGLHIAANYIFGLPDDTQETMQQTLDLACHLNTEMANFYCAMAYPGSPLHAQVSRDNPAALPENNPCGWIGYSQHAYESLPLPTETLTAQQVLDFRDETWMHYFTRPVYLDMMRRTFGQGVVNQVLEMTARGKPRRRHRDTAGE